LVIVEIVIGISIPFENRLESTFPDFFSNFSNSKSTKLEIGLVSFGSHYYMPEFLLLSGTVLIPQNWPLMFPKSGLYRGTDAEISKTFDSTKVNSEEVRKFNRNVYNDLENSNLFISYQGGWQDEKTKNYNVEFSIIYPYTEYDTKTKLVKAIANKYGMETKIQSFWKSSDLYTFPGTALIYKAILEKLPFVSFVLDYPLYELTPIKLEGPF